MKVGAVKLGMPDVNSLADCSLSSDETLLSELMTYLPTTLTTLSVSIFRGARCCYTACENVLHLVIGASLKLTARWVFF